MTRTLIVLAVLSVVWATAQSLYRTVQERRLDAVEKRLRWTHPDCGVLSRSQVRFGKSTARLQISFAEDLTAWLGKISGFGTRLEDPPMKGSYEYTSIRLEYGPPRPKGHCFLWSPRRLDWVYVWGNCGRFDCPWEHPELTASRAP